MRNYLILFFYKISPFLFYNSYKSENLPFFFFPLGNILDESSPNVNQFNPGQFLLFCAWPKCSCQNESQRNKYKYININISSKWKLIHYLRGSWSASAQIGEMKNCHRTHRSHSRHFGTCHPSDELLYPSSSIQTIYSYPKIIVITKDENSFCNC